MSAKPPRSRRAVSMSCARERPLRAFPASSSRTASVRACAWRISAIWISALVSVRIVRNCCAIAALVGRVCVETMMWNRSLRHVLGAYISSVARLRCSETFSGQNAGRSWRQNRGRPAEPAVGLPMSHRSPTPEPPTARAAIRSDGGSRVVDGPGQCASRHVAARSGEKGWGPGAEIPGPSQSSTAVRRNLFRQRRPISSG